MHRAFAFLLVLGSAGLILGCSESTGPDPDAALAKGGLSDGPSNISASPASETVMDINWQDNSRNEGGFELHRSTTGATGRFDLLVKTTQNVHQDQGLTAGAEYCYKVRAFKVSGKNTAVSAFTEVVCRRTLNRPTVPSSVNAVPVNSSAIDVTWVQTSPPAVNGFRVEHSPLPEGPWTDIQFVQAASYRDIGRTSEAQVCYRIIAYNNDGSSPPSTPDCTTPPASPTNLAAVSGDAQSVDLTWTDRSAVEDGFEIQRSVDHNTWTVVGTPSANATTHRDEGLVADTRYFYRIRARKDGGFSDFHGSASAQPVGTVPIAPSDVAAYGWSSTGTGVSWANNATNVEEFRIERSINDGASWETVGTTPPNHGAMSDANRTPEQRVCYRVFAVNRVGDSPASTMDCVTPPARVDDLVATPAGNGSIDLTWSNPSAVTTGYSVQYLELVYPGYGGYCYGYGYGYGCYPYYRWTEIARPGAEATSYRLSGFSSGVVHEFIIVTLAPKAVADASPVASSATEPPPPSE